MNRNYTDYSTYYGRGSQSRPDSVVDYQGGPENAYPYNQNGPRRPRYSSRMSSDQSQGVYNPNAQPNMQQQAYPRSYDNFTAGYTDAYGQPTDSSAIEQVQQRLDERAEAEYGFNGGPNFNGQGPSAPAPVADPNMGGPVGGRTPSAAPATNSLLRKSQNSTSGDGKRKSWFKRRFSKD